MKRNEALYEARLSLGLSRKDAAKKLGVFRLTLRDFEEGYRYLNDKKARKFALAYGLEENSFIIDDKGYFGSIDYEKGKENEERFPKLKNAIASLACRITTAIIMVIFGILSTVGGINYNYTYAHRDLYLPDAYNEIRSSIVAEGEEASFSLTSIFIDSVDAYIHRMDDDPSFAVLIPQPDSSAGTFSFRYEMSDSTYFYLDCFNVGNCAAYYESMEEVAAHYATYDPVTQTLTGQGTSEEELKTIEEMLAIVKEEANAYLATYNAGTVDSFYISLNEVNEALLGMCYISTFVMFLAGFIAVIAMLLLIYGIVRQGKTRKEGLYNKLETFVQEEEIEEVNPREVPRSFDPAPFICKEDYLRYIFLTIFFIGGLARVFDKFQTNGWIDLMTLGNISTVLSYCAGIGTFMVFFLKLEAIISRRDTFLSFLTCFGISSLFYIAEIFIVVLLNNIGFLGTLMSYYLPSNLFTGLAALALFAFFLLNEPKNAKKWQRILFHLAALIPFAYLVGGFVILETAPLISPFLNAALNGGLFEVCVIGTVYIFFIFLCRRFAFHRYGKKGGEEFLTSSMYTLARNIMLSLMIVLLVVLHYVLPDGVITLWTLEKDGYFLLLVPVFLLYRTRVPKPTQKGELIFDGGYLVLLALPFVLAWLVSLLPH